MTVDPEDAEFFRWYGPWSALDPDGGWSIEAFTGTTREHEDVDLSILACDIPAFREHVGDRWNLWCNQGGMLRPLNDRFPEVLAVDSQIWIREHALAPWLIDLPITPDREGLWTSKRWAEHVAPLDDVTWVAGAGIRYVNPEIALHYKARLNRPKDNLDLAVTWPLLSAGQRAWLLEALRATEPGHPWLDELS